MHCYSTDNKKIFFEILGNEKADKTIVFLNGLSQTTQSWGLMTPYFRDDFRIILIDFIYQGNSDKQCEKRDFDMHASDVLAVINTIGQEKIILVGLSYGSIVGQHFAVNYPERLDKMVLLSTFANKTPYYEAIELSWKRALDLGGYSLMLDVMLPFVLSDTYFQNPIIPIDLLKSARKDLVEATSLKKLMEATAERKDYLKELNKITIPTLVIHGRQDSLFPVYLGKAVSDNIPKSKLIIIEEAGHTLNLESVALVSRHIIDFI